MNKQSLNNKGFSLVEILVALAISSMVLLGVALFSALLPYQLPAFFPR